MARTGSGKSLAFLIPLVQRLGGKHATNFGARALILLPARELALQVLKVGKELSRAWRTSERHVGDKEGAEEEKRGQGLRWGLVVGGEGMDEQFEMISSNPDVIIATPGRLLHLIVEMDLDLRSVQYVVFDEADRLFEMGFETALTEIVHRLPLTRQTLLFSATLPKSLVDFARAGLQNPTLVRLDAESKISSDLRMAFFSVKQGEKDASLLVLLRDVIRVPLGTQSLQEDGDRKKGKGKAREHVTAPHQTLVFAATKHHVEYLTNVLTTAGYAVSHIYGSLDQTARTQQMEQFRRGVTSILVVTDVAARGIDIPVLENVVNYDFPHGARVFVHRVGRTARAGRQGWAWSFVTHSELPHLLDLQLFLGRPIRSQISGPESGQESSYTESLILGTFGRELMDEEVEYIRSLDEANHSLPSLREVMRKGHGMYERSKGKASQASYKRAKEMMQDPNKWGLVGAGSVGGVHPVFLLKGRDRGVVDLAEKVEQENRRKALLRAVNSFRPAETVLEIGARGKTGNAALMKERRKALSKAVERATVASTSAAALGEDEVVNHEDVEMESVEMADEEDIQAIFEVPEKRKEHFRDSDFYIYSLRDGASFVEQAQHATFDLAGDEGTAGKKRAQLNWDKKRKKFVKGDGAGADNVKMVKTESGVKLPATYRSGRFDEWKAKSRISLPKVGEAEGDTSRRSVGGKRFKHNKVVSAKPLDKLSHDYERKVRQQKQRASGAGDVDKEAGKGKPRALGAKGGRYGGKTIGRVKSELKSAEQIRRDRKATENRRAKNARPTRRKSKR
ncbi:hypothetical protein EW146_g934 [Bondarzewia mesenterica]|uniref:RNA helicase n=1 Tax=Bondarzewia mesenterica TaxID=1095465 RepID=A0A4S4M5I6_9AGAM|nr:hypothetical protein EW146_g934 [Bondarzewia mesenterica]